MVETPEPGEQLVFLAKPSRCQLIIPPVGATDPAAPVTVAVNVIGAPKTLVRGVPTIVTVGVAGNTTTGNAVELVAV